MTKASRSKKFDINTFVKEGTSSREINDLLEELKEQRSHEARMLNVIDWMIGSLEFIIKQRLTMKGPNKEA